MALPAAKYRELLLLALYSREGGVNDPHELALFLMRELKVARRPAREACEQAERIAAHLSEIDERIARQLDSYALERLHSVERNVLRLALYELQVEKLQPALVIAEAKRLARKFSGPEAEPIIHAVVDKLAASFQPAPPVAETK